MPDNYFPKVKQAREALRAKALELYEQYDKTVKLAIAAEKYEEALTAMQWLMEHMPEEDGVKMLDQKVDTPKPIDKSHSGPTIQIGIALGTPKAKELVPLNVIDADLND